MDTHGRGVPECLDAGEIQSRTCKFEMKKRGKPMEAMKMRFCDHSGALGRLERLGRTEWASKGTGRESCVWQESGKERGKAEGNTRDRRVK